MVKNKIKRLPASLEERILKFIISKINTMYQLKTVKEIEYLSGGVKKLVVKVKSY